MVCRSCVIGPFAVNTRRRATLLGLAALLCLTQTGWAEDVVVVSRSKPPGESRRLGTITEYTGEYLTLQLPSGREEKIESSRVLSYTSELVPDQQNGDQLLLAGRFADAAASYLRASKVENRRWMRRVLLAQLVRCYTNMQQIDRAGDAFLAIVGSDPTTQLFDAIPLAWVPTPPTAGLFDRSKRWIEDKDIPAARLMGASWLLATAQRQQALDVLGKLAGDADSRIAMLAETQIWRDKTVTASIEDVERWQQRIRGLDASLRAGPHFLVGKALARHGRSAEAAVALMRVPVLHPEQQDLAAEALFAAGEQLEKMGDRGGARTVYKELVQTYRTHRLAQPAQQRLQRSATN